MEKSKIITGDLRVEFNTCYINFNLLKMNKQIINSEQAIYEIKDLIKKYNKTNQVEIEKKYIVKDKSIFDKTEKAILSLESYEMDASSEILQEDIYFDTEENILEKSNKTLRIREKEGKFILTVKTGTKKNTDKTLNEEDQNERFEYEKYIEDNNIKDNTDYILKYLPELKGNIDNIIKTLIIRNERKKVKLIQNEVVFDDVEYIGNKKAKECQIEIELKSSYRHRVNLKKLTDYLERQVPELKLIIESKYVRGLKLTE